MTTREEIIEEALSLGQVAARVFADAMFHRDLATARRMYARMGDLLKIIDMCSTTPTRKVH